MTDSVQPRRLSDYATSMLPSERHKLEEIEGIEVIINSARVGATKFGSFAAMECVKSTGEVLTVVTGGFMVVDAIAKAIEADAFPLAAKFSRPKQCWIME